MTARYENVAKLYVDIFTSCACNIKKKLIKFRSYYKLHSINN